MQKVALFGTKRHGFRGSSPRMYNVRKTLRRTPEFAGTLAGGTDRETPARRLGMPAHFGSLRWLPFRRVDRAGGSVTRDHSDPPSSVLSLPSSFFPANGDFLAIFGRVSSPISHAGKNLGEISGIIAPLAAGMRHRVQACGSGRHDQPGRFLEIPSSTRHAGLLA